MPGGVHGGSADSRQRADDYGAPYLVVIRATPRRVRAIACALLVVVAASLSPLLVVSAWASASVTDAKGFASAMASLGRNETVTNYLGVRAADDLTTSLHVERFVQNRIPFHVASIAQTITKEFTAELARILPSVLRTTPLQRAIDAQLGTLHGQFVQLITAGASSPAGRRGLTLTVRAPLAPVIRDFDRLGIRYLDPLRRLEGREVTVTLASPAAFARWRWYFATAINDQLALVLGFVAAALGAVAVATRRRRATVALLVGVAVANLVALLLLAVGDQYTVGAATGSAVAHAIISTLTADLRVELGVAVAGTGVLALAVWLTGPAPSAVTARGHVTAAIADLTRRREARTHTDAGQRPYLEPQWHLPDEER